MLPRYLTPQTTANRVAGLALTGQGYPCASTTDDDTQTRLNMLDSITPGTVSVWACGGSVNCAHWGEMMSTAARQRGCSGGVLDGGVRDLDFIVPQELTLDVLSAAENIHVRESGMREELRRGVSVKEAYAKYGSLSLYNEKYLKLRVDRAII